MEKVRDHVSKSPNPPTSTSPKSARTRSLKKPKKDAIFSIIKGDIYHKHEIFGKDDPFVKIIVGGKEKKTSTLDNTQKPEWNEDIIFENFSEEDAQNVEVIILDEDTVGPPCVIGSAKLSLLDYLNKKKRISLPLFIKDKEEAKLELDVVLLDAGEAAKQPVMPRKSAENEKEKEKDKEKKSPRTKDKELKTPVPVESVAKGNLSVSILRARNLPMTDDGGRGAIDPYVKIQLGDQIFRTSKKENDLNPVYNETFEFLDPPGVDNITFTLFDVEETGPAEWIAKCILVSDNLPEGQSWIVLVGKVGQWCGDLLVDIRRI